MKHYGDICKINGADVPAVDVVTGGSPCQDLSVAGKRAGLDGERSGLFMEQVRVIKEMREADVRSGRTNEYIRPRYMVWENVPGALSSNGGEDFRIVLEETARVADESAVIPRPEGRWSNAGAVVGDGWSIAWRIHDAQFWGVPQRRKRIALVADFGGLSAPEILFERKGLSGDSEQSGAKRKATAGAVGGGAEGASKCKCINPYDPQSERVFHGDGAWHSLSSNSGGGQANQSVSDKAGALNTMHDQQAVMCFQNTGQGWWNESEIGATIRTPCGGDSVKANLVSVVGSIVRRTRNTL